MMSFNDFVYKHNLKNKATSSIKNQQILSSLGLNDVDMYLRDGPFSNDIGIVNLHPSKGTNWVCYINENYFDGYEFVSPKELPKFIIKRKGCVYILNTKYKV